MDFATIAKLRKYLSVKHHIPGRIRISFDRAIMVDKEALTLAKSAPEMPDAVTSAKVNIFSKSLKVEYDASRVAPALLEELINAPSDAAAADVLQRLHVVLYGE